MAIKDRFDRLVSYFDTDDASEVEEAQEVSQSPRAERPVQQNPQPRPQQASPARPQATGRPQTQQARPQAPARPSQEEKVRNMPNRSNDVAIPATGGTTIALKFPRKYEDAQEIVDLLIKHECVLIDFQYMLEAQARRCLDFIDGASRVLYGSLQKVGSSMYLLTPKDVVVDMEEMNLSNASQEVSFDYDMKRR